MQHKEKTEIQSLLAEFINGYATDAQAIAQLKDVSQSTAIAIRDNNWQNISDNMWRNVGKQVGWSVRKNPEPTETLDFNTLIFYYATAKEESEMFAIIGGAGYGKTFTAEWYTSQMKGKNVYLLKCDGLWNIKYFLQEMLQAMGRSHIGMNAYEMQKTLISELRKQHRPLFIFDEIDKLLEGNPAILKFFITLYNALRGLCGIIWQGSPRLKKIIVTGYNKRKTGFEEIYSRIGRIFIELVGTNHEELTSICQSYGMSSIELITQLSNEYEGDLRRVDRVKLKDKLKKAA